MRSASRLKEYVNTEAEEMGVDLDAVREVETDADGTTIRVLAVDGETEADQVGFQVTEPNVETGRQMFNRRLGNGLRTLRSRLKDDEDSDSNSQDQAQNVGESTSENNGRQEDNGLNSPSTASGSATSNTTTSASQTPPGHELGQLSVSVALEDDSRSDLTSQFESLLDDLESETVSDTQFDELEERVDDIDDRLASIEEKLSLLSSD